jgi:hypothetical protein
MQLKSLRIAAAARRTLSRQGGARAYLPWSLDALQHVVAVFIDEFEFVLSLLKSGGTRIGGADPN